MVSGEALGDTVAAVSAEQGAARPHGGVRSARERVIQTLAFEAGGLLLVGPLYALATGTRLDESLVLLLAVSVVIMLWSAVFNWAFDVVEHRRTGRVASQRPHRLRVLHAVLHEATAVVVTCPVIWALTDLGWIGALLADLGLTLAYTLYAYAFHCVYDRLRPVQSTT
jgi:uncharacterized membrane protein